MANLSKDEIGLLISKNIKFNQTVALSKKSVTVTYSITDAIDAIYDKINKEGGG
jgi:uncharacterized protein YdaT